MSKKLTIYHWPSFIRPMNKAVALFLFIFALGVVVRWMIVTNELKSFADGDIVQFEARLIVSPKVENGLQKLRVTPRGYRELRIVAPVYPQYQYGERVRIKGVVTEKIFENGEVNFTSYFPEIERADDTSILFGLTRTIRTKVKVSFSSILPPSSAGLLLGIVFGVKEGLSQDFETALQRTGVFHVIAASGMNVSMLSGFLMAILSRFLRRQTAIVLCILSIGFYTLLAGLDPSIIRASVMATIAFSAMLLGRQGTAMWSLILTALIMLLFDPFLYKDIGFQLSFAATCGILLIKPLLSLGYGSRGETPKSLGVSPLKEPLKEHHDTTNPTLALLTEDLGSTTAAQITTIPIMLFYFHQYGVLSIPINALVLWTIPPLMILGSLGALASFVFLPLAAAVILMALPFLWLFEFIVMHLELYNPVVGIEKLSPFVVLFYYGLITIIFIIKRRGSRG